MSSKSNLSNFTIRNDHNVDENIRRDISIIESTLKKILIDIEAVYLVGGFGRGEGSVLLFNSKVIMINDYDIVVLTNIKPSLNLIEKILKIIKNKITIKQIDITYYSLSDFKNLNKTVYNYDLKYFSKIIYEKKQYLNLIPTIKKNFHLSEAQLPLEVYLSALLLSFPEKGNFKKNSKEDIFWIYHQISKSIIGWSMYDLIKKGCYEASYVERIKVINKIYVDKHNQHKLTLATKAINFKLKPYFDIKEDLKILWYDNAEIHLDMIKKEFFNINLLNINIPYVLFKYKLKNILKFIYGYLFNKQNYKEYSNLFLSKLFFLMSLQKAGINKKYFNKSLHYLKKIGFEINKENNLNQILSFLKQKDPNCKQFLESIENFADEKK